MLGGIIGDLAATTWQKDKSTFYKSLFAPDTQLTEYGLMASKLAHHLAAGVKFDYLEFIRSIAEISWEQIVSFNLIAMATIAWSEDDAQKAIGKFLKKFTNSSWEKEDFYAFNTIIPLIVALRQGATKDEALDSLEVLFRDTLSGWSKGERGSLGAIARAWDACYRSFDFTSAIHSAVKSPVEPNLTAVIAGLIAEAMYGSEIGMVKKKYSDNPFFYIEFPKDIDIMRIRAYNEQHRKFFPKNRALTNVERHVWKPSDNPYRHITFGESLYNKIRMALDTSWENRYGIYLDNGWYYVYRSHILLARFKIAKTGTKYRIENVQHSDEMIQDTIHAMWDALYSIQCPPFQKSKPPVLVPIFQHMSCYHGESQNPYDGNKDPSKASIWYGEKMFMEAIDSFDYWKRQAKEIKKKQNIPNPRIIERLTVEQLAIKLYIETLYAKWCPYEKDFMWIYETND